tara:strand:+ start:2684 stop:2953 length:270 start_codon:yes stop_codon:yes gene_type:complete
MNLFKKKFKTTIYFFCFGFAINSILNTLNIIENREQARLELIEKKFFKNQQEKICKEKSSYSKFFEMGFKETAQKRLNSCMKQSNFISK